MPKKLLLAEDSITIRKVFELAFAQSDISITAVDSGEDAVRLAGESSPDLVVADVTLPDKDGYAVAAELGSGEKTKDIPVLVLSGTIVPIDEPRLKACGAKGVLFKPFETRELLEKVEGLLRERAEAPSSSRPDQAPAGDEHWDFSDVLDEVEDEAGKAPAGAPAKPREEILPGVLLPGGAKAASVAFNEFDVSIDEIEGAAPPAEPNPPVDSHIEGAVTADAPPAVTDLSLAMEEPEEVGEIEEPEPVFPEPRHEAPTKKAQVTASPVETLAVSAAPAPPAERPAAVPPPAPPVGDRASFPLLQEQFASRAEEIFRAVASEAVEKVMWEMMDRLTAEFSAKVRESVEAVAWEVIPATAEALIREEIARIRAQSGKPSP